MKIVTPRKLSISTQIDARSRTLFDACASERAI